MALVELPVLLLRDRFLAGLGGEVGEGGDCGGIVSLPGSARGELLAEVEVLSSEEK